MHFSKLIDLKMKKDDTPTEKLTRPRSAASRSDLEKLASKAQVEKIQERTRDICPWEQFNVYF